MQLRVVVRPVLAPEETLNLVGADYQLMQAGTNFVTRRALVASDCT
jgi:hypothetical protein